MQDKEKEFKNITLAIFISTMFIILWQLFFDPPSPGTDTDNSFIEQKIDDLNLAEPDFKQLKVFEDDQNSRIKIDTKTLEGSIAKTGGRIDDLVLKKYNENLNDDSKKVTLLSPSGKEQSYFIDFGWLSSNTQMPGRATRWRSNRDSISESGAAELIYTDANGIEFTRRYFIDENYMFTIEQQVINNSQKAILLKPYALINRELPDDLVENFILHEGPIGYLNDELVELSYSEVEEEKKISFNHTSGWFGITDKYWLTSIIPDEKSFDVNISAFEKNNIRRFQTDYSGKSRTLLPGGRVKSEFKFFAGPKEVSLLDMYEEKYGIPLFDRAVDFGSLYFLTKPIFTALHFINEKVNNFGIAIIILTVIIKILLYPLAKKSYVSLNKMRELHPEMVRIRELYLDDRMRMNQELMDLYKRENVNPAAGCLPILLQVPIFFALYKVLFVTIEMRHAPFYGWISDLSVKDPTNIFTLFGLLKWDTPSLLEIGIWPLLMAITMIIQTRMNPKPTDPAQEKVMKILPIVFTFIFATFPAGLVIYWTFSNILTIIQQWMIKRKYIS